jgi:hypothetical protein
MLKKIITHLSYQSNGNIPSGRKAMGRRIYIRLNMEMGQLRNNFVGIIKTILAQLLQNNVGIFF